MPANLPISTPSPRLILASSSSYRRELLERLRLPFTCVLPDIDETPLANELPGETAMRLAETKARTVATANPDALVIGSDQVATLDAEQIGKPGSHAKALEQLRKMRGREVVFHTALCLLDARSSNPKESVQLENIQTRVAFRDLPETDLDNYLRIERPYDCAGSAKNEGLGIALIECIQSTDPTALTGLPLISLCSMLRRAGFIFFEPQ